VQEATLNREISVKDGGGGGSARIYQRGDFHAIQRGQVFRKAGNPRADGKGVDKQAKSQGHK
jgi:hypothetical protein